MTSEWAAAARLVRRTGFGATGSAVDAVVTEGATAYVARILAADPTKDAGATKTPVPTFGTVAPITKDAGADAKKTRRKALHGQDQQLTAWWIRRMAAVDAPFGEKLTFAWHAHFATSLQKVKDASLMAQQNERLRGLGRSEFGTLAYTMLTDAATQKWLDGEKNTVTGPNENLSREYMEIFTLGHGDGYTEDDVRQGARALTGYKIMPNGSLRLRPKLHDNGSKTVLGKTGNLDASGFCDAVLARPGSATYVLGRLWGLLVSNTAPTTTEMARLTAAYGPSRNLTAAITTMLTDSAFTSAQGSFVIGPVEWMLGAVRALKVPLSSDSAVTQVSAALDSLGQKPFYPPSVGGWPSGQVWLSTAAADLRFRTASHLVTNAQLPSLTGSTTTKLATLAHFLGVDSWSDHTLTVLKGSMSSTAHLVAVALNTPEYLVH